MQKKHFVGALAVTVLVLSAAYIIYDALNAGHNNLTPNRGPNRPVTIQCSLCGYTAQTKHSALSAQAAVTPGFWAPVERPNAIYQTIPCPKNPAHRAWVLEAGQSVPADKSSDEPTTKP